MDHSLALDTYQRDVLYKHRMELQSIPSKYHGIINSTIQYKHLRGELTKMLGHLIDSVVPQLSKPLQRLTDALVDFSAAYGNNLGTYYTLFGVCSGLMEQVVAQRDVNSANALMDAVINAVSVTTDVKKCSEELKEALKQLNRTIIQLSANKNTQQLEENVENAFMKAKKLMMQVEDLKRDLAIERSTLQQLEDMTITDKDIEENLRQRIEKELNTVQQQQQVLQKAISEDGTKTTTTHHAPYYGWRWWYYGGGYSYTTTQTKDTKSEQNLAKRNISDIDDRVNSLRQKLEEKSQTRNKRTELTKANISRLRSEISVLEDRRNTELEAAKDMEAQLTRARCEAAGCDTETSKKLAEAFKLTVPLFMQLADTTSQVSNTFSTVKSVISATSKIPVLSAITVFDAVCKMAIAGDFVGNNSFTIASENHFKNQMVTIDQVYNSTTKALQQLPTGQKTYEMIEDVRSVAPENKEDAEKVSVVSGIKVVDPSELF